MERKKILVLAPHPDDEVLGIGSYLLKESKKGAIIRFVFATTDGTERRVAEVQRVMYNFDNCSHRVLCPCFDGKLHTQDFSALVSMIDEEIYSFEPDELFVNYPSHHQDHRTLYDCTMAALRLKTFFTPPLVALYEYPFVVSNSEPIPGGKWYVPMSEKDLWMKKNLFDIYESQQKEFPSPLNGHGIATLAAVRGLECGFPYAECFYIQKMVL